MVATDRDLDPAGPRCGTTSATPVPSTPPAAPGHRARRPWCSSASARSSIRPRPVLQNSSTDSPLSTFTWLSRPARIDRQAPRRVACRAAPPLADEVMPAASLLVGHGGHGTTLRALSHDLPVLHRPARPPPRPPDDRARRADAGAGRLPPPARHPADPRDGPHLLTDEPVAAPPRPPEHASAPPTAPPPRPTRSRPCSTTRRGPATPPTSAGTDREHDRAERCRGRLRTVHRIPGRPRDPRRRGARRRGHPHRGAYDHREPRSHRRRKYRRSRTPPASARRPQHVR